MSWPVSKSIIEVFFVSETLSEQNLLQAESYSLTTNCTKSNASKKELLFMILDSIHCLYSMRIGKQTEWVAEFFKLL